MKKIGSMLIVAILFAVVADAQSLRKEAEANPLDSAIYLFSCNKETVNAEDLTRTLFEVGRYDDLLETIRSVENNFQKISLLAIYSKSLLGKNKRREAERFLTTAITAIRSDKDRDEAGNHEMRIIAASLAALNRFAEVAEIVAYYEDDDEYKPQILTAVAEVIVLQTSQIGRAEDFLTDALELSERQNDQQNILQIAELYTKIGQKEKAASILERIEKTYLLTGDGENIRSEILLALVRIHLRLGEKNEALALWQQYGTFSDGRDIYNFAAALSDYGNYEEAAFYLEGLRQDRKFMAFDGNRLVEFYLKRNDTQTARKIAETMSDEDDSYYQQKALMLVADKLIRDGANEPALEILNFAFTRARRIVYEHRTQDSIGASPGSRKEIYLRGIYKRLIDLKQFDKAFDVFRSVNRNELFEGELFAELLVDFAGRQFNILPRRKTQEFFAQAQNAVKDDDYHTLNILTRIAEVHARMGEKAKAIKLLTEVLAEANEHYYQNDFLLGVGKVFEQYKLKADIKMKKVLREYISEED